MYPIFDVGVYWGTLTNLKFLPHPIWRICPDMSFEGFPQYKVCCTNCNSSAHPRSTPHALVLCFHDCILLRFVVFISESAVLWMKRIQETKRKLVRSGKQLTAFTRQTLTVTVHSHRKCMRHRKDPK